MNSSSSSRFHRLSRTSIPWVVAAALVVLPGGAAAQGSAKIQKSALQQMAVLRSVKAAKSASEAKIDSRLYLAILHQQGDPRLAPLRSFRFLEPDDGGTMLVDIKTTSAAGVKQIVDRVQALGGEVRAFHFRYKTVQARVPLAAVESLASSYAVRSIGPAEKPFFSKVNTSEGDVAHRAAEAWNYFGVDGSGVKVCVLSDGVDSLATLQASGDLPPVVDVLPGQAGSGNEGTAMLEIVHDLAPGAALGFATVNPDQATFAQNILDLATSGCGIIVDDVIYLAESPFQDSVVADAVNQVTANGVLYFSSAGNEGNLDDCTSGTWEGDFNPNGTPAALAGAGPVNDFGDGGQSQLVTATSAVVVLHWTDVFGASGNDYDVYDMDGGLTTIFDASTNTQNGTGDPVEISGLAFSGERLVVAQFSGADRLINLNNFRGRVALQTAGCTRGHSAAADAFSVAAVDVATASGGAFTGGAANPVEPFSCDGPRRIFFDASGSLLPGAPAGDFSSTGGVVRQKPDVAAADGVAVATPGFNPFFGTSAAAPHAAAVAALVEAAFPAYTAAQVRTALEGSALDIEAPGTDRDSGVGIVMAYETLADNGAAPQAYLETAMLAPSEVAGDGDSTLEPGEDWALTIPLTNSGGAGASVVSATLTMSTPGVAILSGASTYPDLTPSSTAPNASPYVIGLASNLICGGSIDLTLTVTTPEARVPRPSTSLSPPARRARPPRSATPDRWSPFRTAETSRGLSPGPR